jgi:hypothetical protein
MTCSVLTSLPDSIISVIMTSWLTSTDLGRLDAASCSTLDRQAFLSTLMIDTLTVNFNDEDRPPPPSEEKWNMYVNFLRWSTLRGARVAELAMCGAVFTDELLRRKLLSINGTTLRSIEFASRVIDGQLSAEVVNDYINIIAEVANACGRVRTLKVYSEWGGDNFLPTILQAFGQIQILKLQSLMLTSGGLQQIPWNTSTLMKVTISGAAGSGVTLPPDLAIPTLVYFDGRGCNVTDALVVALGQNCPLLQTLLFYNQSNSITDRGARALLLGCPQLRTCTVEYLGGVSDELRVELARRCEYRTICFSWWSGISDMLARSVVAVIPELIQLDAVMCPWLTDATLAVAARQCTALEELHLSNSERVTIAGIRPFLRPGNKLNCLWLCGEGDDTLMQLIGQHCKALRTLHVFNSGNAELRVTDVGVRAVLQGCPLLHRTDVEHARGISHELRLELARRNAHASLQLSKWRELSEELLIGIFRVSPHLQNLKCVRSDALTDVALAACAQHCQELASISIEECAAVTSSGLIEYFRPGNQLASIGLHSMQCVDDSVAEAILRHCRRVQTMFLPAGLSEGMQDRLRQLCPYVSFATAEAVNVAQIL